MRLGDSGYALRENMMVPFENAYDPDSVDSSKERFFNYIHSSARITVERAFGILKGRFRILKKRLEFNSPIKSASLVTACIVLHNFILMHDKCDAMDFFEEDTMLFSNAENFVISARESTSLQDGRIKRNCIPRTKSYICFESNCPFFVAFNRRRNELHFSLTKLIISHNHGPKI